MITMINTIKQKTIKIKDTMNTNTTNIENIINLSTIANKEFVLWLKQEIKLSLKIRKSQKETEKILNTLALIKESMIHIMLGHGQLVMEKDFVSTMLSTMFYVIIEILSGKILPLKETMVGGAPVDLVG